MWTVIDLAVRILVALVFGIPLWIVRRLQDH